MSRETCKFDSKEAQDALVSAMNGSGIFKASTVITDVPMKKQNYLYPYYTGLRGIIITNVQF